MASFNAQHPRREALEHFLRLVRCGVRREASPAESAAFRLATHVAASVCDLDEIAAYGLLQFAALARTQPLVAEDFTAGRIVDVDELLADRYVVDLRGVHAAEAACEEPV